MDTEGYQSPGGSLPAPPEIVIVPAHPDPGGTEISFEVREGPIGMNVVPVFSSVRKLVVAFGEAQPWVAMPLRRVRELAAEGGVLEVLLDPAVLPGSWEWSFTDLETLEQVLDRPQDDGNAWR
jgi:SseB protein N-terminal domain